MGMKVYVIDIIDGESLTVALKPEFSPPLALLPFLDYEALRASNLAIKTLQRNVNQITYYLAREKFIAVVHTHYGTCVELREPEEIEIPEALEPFIELPE